MILDRIDTVRTRCIADVLTFCIRPCLVNLDRLLLYPLTSLGERLIRVGVEGHGATNAQMGGCVPRR